jgi:hypothetical protein
MPNFRLRWSVLPAAVFMTGAVGSAHAQNATTQQNAPAVVAPGSLGLVFNPTQVSPSPELGAKLSDTAILHLGVTAEAGVDTNVFYENRNQVDSPVLRITPFVQITNATRSGGAPDGAFYSLAAALLYREYASANPDVKAQRAFNPSVSGSVEFGARQNLSFAIIDNYSRSEEPPYGASSSNITRNYNMANVQLRWTPNGGRLTSLVRYTNSLDFFENEDLKHANSIRHDMMLDLSWKWLPKTALYVMATQGYVSYINDSPQRPLQNSFPLRVLTGLRGLLTEKLTVNLGVGYTNGFYQNNAANPSGWGNFLTTAEMVYRPTLRTQATLGYVHEFRNSVIGNFYEVDGVYASIGYTFADRLIGSVFGRYEYRRFQHRLPNGAINPFVNGRKDDTIQAGAALDYFLQRWFFVGAFYVYAGNRAQLAYQVMNVTTPPPTIVGVDYDKHMVLGRIGVTY